MIGSDTIFTALTVVVLFMVLLSLPSIYVTLSHSSRQFKKYRKLRQLMSSGVVDAPPKMVHEWNAVKTDVGYITVLSEELEKVGALRSALFNAEIAAILIVVMMFIPGFETGVFIFMFILLALCVISLVYGYKVTKLYGEEYVNIARTLSGKGEESKDSMYV